MKKQNCNRPLKITTNSNKMVEQFCKSILQIETRNSKSLANLVMGLSSQQTASSVVEVSLNDCYHYEYSSIAKTIARLGKPKRKKKNEKAEQLSRQAVEKKFAY